MSSSHIKLPTDRPLNVGVDLDGVCYDFQAKFRQQALLRGYAGASNPALEWNFYEAWPMTTQVFIEECNASVERGQLFWDGHVIDEAHLQLARMLDAGHEVHIVTARNFGYGDISERATRHWLAKNNFRFSSLTLHEDKTVVPTDVFIEDRLENYDRLVEAGTIAYLVNRPWNQIREGDDRLRVSSITEFVNIILDSSNLSETAR